MVVEDEMMISLLIETVLADHGCIVVGPYSRLPEALEAARRETMDLAVLDVNLASEKVYPVAEALSARGVRFLLLSGYGQSAVPADRRGWRVCSKPFRSGDLLRELADLVAAPPAVRVAAGRT